MKSYLFYDIETTGLNKAFDQVLQFAAIRTDEEFNEIQRYNMQVKLRPDVLYSPDALLTTEISIDETTKGQPEYEVIQRIHVLMNQPGTISVGYNSLGFDDEFLRFSFYRNLLPPYTHQYANNCGRMDLLPITVLYFLFKPEVLNEWPEINGKSSMRLEHINKVNELVEGQAHDALVDVKITLALARIFANHPDMWKYVTAYFDKKTDLQRQQDLPISFSMGTEDFRTGLMIDTSLGASSSYLAPVLWIGMSEAYSNQSLWLRLDQQELDQTEMDDPESTTWMIRKKFGEPPIILPPEERFWSRLDNERKKLTEYNLGWIRDHSDTFLHIVHHYREFEWPKVPNVDPDAALYQVGFPTDQETELFNRFHQADPENKAQMLDRFDNQTHRDLATRLLARNYPEVLPNEKQSAYQTYLQAISNDMQENQHVIDYRGNRHASPQSILKRIEELREDPAVNASQRKLLDELEEQVRSQFGD